MKVFTTLTDPELAAMIRHGAIGVIPTDTLYGVVASISQPDAITRLYEVRKRPLEKGCITLLADMHQAQDLIVWDDLNRQLAEKYWPGPVSIVLPVRDASEYLHPVDNTLAFRVPSKEDLRELLFRTGPLFAPSANVAGEKPAATIKEAQDYFGDSIDFYVEAGDLSANKPSALIRQVDGALQVLRGNILNK